jgi:hypothetical protein
MTNIAQFHYDAATAHFSAEMSEIDGFHQVGPDSADEGVTVYSPTTGRSITFVVVAEGKDADGDTTYWMLESLAGTQVDGKFTGFTMTVFND